MFNIYYPINKKMKITIFNDIQYNHNHSMAELILCLQDKNCNEKKIEKILNNKLIITETHIKNIDRYYKFNIIKLFEKYGYVFTNDDYMLLVNINGCYLKYISNKTEELCRAAVIKNGNALLYVEQNKRTNELYELAIRGNRNMLHFIDENNSKMKQFYEIAVQYDGLALVHIPSNKITDKLCRIAIENNVWAFKYVPINKITDKMCKNVVQKKGLILQCIPKDKN